jgi:putative tricarboxylic transport membrane protein
MEHIQSLLNGFIVLFSWQNILLATIGGILGLIIGAVPGIGALTAISMLLPITFGMNPTSAIVMLCSLYYATMYGGAYSAILLNVPGDSGAIMTSLDGYPLAKKGGASKALMASNASSFVGGSVGIIILTFGATALARFGLIFGAAEMTTMLLLAMTSITWMIGENPIKGLIATLLGSLIACIGTDPITANERMTFGNLYLLGGVNFVPLIIGAFGFSQVITLVTAVDGEISSIEKLSMRKAMLTKNEWARILPICLRNGLLGSIIGVLPGSGATTAAAVGYMVQRKFFKSEEPLGEGAIEGIAACESANNAACAGSFATLLSLGIPGSSTGAILLGGLMMWGLKPGPLLFATNPDFAWGTIASLYFANIFVLVCGLLLVPLLVKVISVPNRILVPVIAVICIVGSYGATRSMYGVFTMIISGVLCYILTIHRYPLTPLLLSFVLTPLLETYMRRAFATSVGKLSIFWASGISKTFLFVFIALLLSPIGRWLAVKIVSNRKNT